MPTPSPAIVLYAKDLALTRQFYETLGLAFVEERHGDGPTHYACDAGGFVLELYPEREHAKAAPACAHMAMVWYAHAFDRVVTALLAMDAKPGRVTTYDEDRGLRGVSVRDPDGRLVRLLEADPQSVH